MNHHFFQAKNLDLAMEATSCLRGKSNREIEGIRETIRRTEHTQITEIEILNEKGAQRMGRSIGNYITVEIPELTRYNEASFVEDIVWTIIGVLRHLYTAPKDKPTLIIGLGNLFTFMVALTFLGGCVMLSLKARALPFPKWLLFFLCCFLYILLYMGIEALTTIFFVTLDKEMIEAINLSVYESQDVIYMLLSEIPSQWWRLWPSSWCCPTFFPPCLAGGCPPTMCAP